MALKRPQMEVISSDDIEIGGDDDYLCAMLIGDGKVGKTFTVLKTCVQPVFVINCDKKSALRGARRHGLKFQATKNVVKTAAEMDLALRTAKYKVVEEGFKTVLLDTLSNYGKSLIREMKATRVTRDRTPDTRRAWGDFGDIIIDQVERLIDLPANVIINCHYIQQVDEAGGKKTEHGRVPLLQGRAAKVIPGMMDDIIYMKKAIKGSPPKGVRIFVTSEDGVYGAGGRSVDVSEMPASIKRFMREAGMLPPLEKKK